MISWPMIDGPDCWASEIARKARSPGSCSSHNCSVFLFLFFQITMCTLHGRMVPWVQQGAVRFPSLEMEPGTALFFFVPICFIHSRGIVQRPMLASSTITIGSWVPPTPRARRKQEPRSIASWFLSAAKASIFLSWPIKVSFVY